MIGRLAVVLFNLGGPDSPDAVQPFLFNLFDDPAIIGAPGPIRRLLASAISRRRAKIAREIYARLGGGSPLLPLTRKQADALERELGRRAIDARTFVCMRYWHPMSDAVAAEVRDFAPDRIVLLPLYPQFSTTTTSSSLRDWRRAADAAGLEKRSVAICCWPTEPGLIGAIVAGIRVVLDGEASGRAVRILFSAHGLPERVIKRGDPYQWQVERTVEAVVAALGGGVDHRVCYQSRVGPLKWIRPSLEEMLEEAARDAVGVVVVPVAFVSEHSETLVELDIEYRARAEALGVPGYWRVPTPGTTASFIAGLATLVEKAARRSPGDLLACAGCPVSQPGCPRTGLAAADGYRG